MVYEQTKSLRPGRVIESMEIARDGMPGLSRERGGWWLVLMMGECDDDSLVHEKQSLFHDAHVHMWQPQYHKTSAAGFVLHRGIRTGPDGID